MSKSLSGQANGQSFAIVIRCCLSSVMRVYCDKTAEARITRFSLESSNCRIFSTVSLTTKFEGVPSIKAQTMVGLFSISRRYISITARDRDQVTIIIIIIIIIIRKLITRTRIKHEAEARASHQVARRSVNC